MLNDHTEWNKITLEANGVVFSALEMGKGPLVLALHGFPDTPRTFRLQAPALAAAGYHVVAPYLRGFAPTMAPENSSFEIAELVQDVLALIDQLTGRPAALLGHDLGAVAAYTAAILAPDKIFRLAAIAVPHGGVLTRALITSPAQQRRSWYMFFFQMPFAEIAVAYNDYAFLDHLWQDWSPGWAYPPEEMEAVKETFRQPGVLQAALNYYRSNLDPTRQRPDLAEVRKHLGEPVPVPTLYLHGARDGCLDVELTSGMERFFPAGLEKRVIPAAGHFVHQEQPREVNSLLLDFLSRG